jgi:hypothetical protein
VNTSDRVVADGREYAKRIAESVPMLERKLTENLAFIAYVQGFKDGIRLVQEASKEPTHG